MRQRCKVGFSIAELLVVVTTIGILALLGMPGIRIARERTQATTTANDLRVYTEALEFYATVTGKYPDEMTYTSMPEDVNIFLPNVWKNGAYSWFYVNSNYYTYVYIFNLNFTAEQAVRLDSILDDGNIATGDIRVALNGGGLIFLFSYTPLGPAVPT
ncbi:MAG: type II secretion system protein [Verrucomicrobiota bacterium]